MWTIWIVTITVSTMVLSSTISEDFESFSRIQPEYYHGRSKRSIPGSVKSSISTKHRRRHWEDLIVTFRDSKRDRVLILDLTLNGALLPPDSYFEKYQKNNSYVVDRPGKDVEFCYYNGRVRDHPGSWVALSTCDDSLTGILYDGAELFHIQNNYLYNDADRIDERKCDFPDTPTRIRRHISTQNDQPKPNDTSKDQSSLFSQIRRPWNANKRSRYVELILVVDNKEFRDHGQDLRLVYRMCKDIANVMNALYTPLNIYIALVGVVVWTEHDEITLDTKGDKTLTNFLHYRREILVKEHPNDNAQLLTGIEFQDGVVGKALKGPICTYEFSGGVSMWHSDVISLVATTVAHELGHNFGMEHDTEDCTCPDDRCIMAPASSTMKPSFWSSCSLEHLALAFEQGMDYCLRNKPTILFDGPVCGNGFVEEGEECDCGLKHHCDNKCCDPDTCTLSPGALCATGECCDFETCKPKESGVQCRSTDHECDLPEFCTGTNEYCPEDVHKVDGTTCKHGQAFCYNGSCRTHTDQCKLLWGPSGKKSDNQCYEQNVKGTRHGNCGYSRTNQSYVECQEVDVRCGMLHCSHLNKKLEFGMEHVSILSHSFINTGGKIIPCRTALVDLGLNDVDPGLAPEGAQCGENRLCVNRKCMPVSSLVLGPHSCECNGHGSCNSKGHCHCDYGFSPPDCIRPGNGGSTDSGPAGDPRSQDKTGLIVMYVLLVVIALIAIPCLILLAKKKRLTPEKASRFLRKNLLNSSISNYGRGRDVDEDDEADSRKNDKKIDISKPTLAATTFDGGSSESSPTHALLPSTKSKMNSAPTTKSMTKTDTPTSTSPSETATSSMNVAFKPDKFSLFKRKSLENANQGIMQSIAKSITFPSPKFRSSKLCGNGDASAPKYVIKVEHRKERSNSEDSILSPISPTEYTEVAASAVPSSHPLAIAAAAAAVPPPVAAVEIVKEKIKPPTKPCVAEAYLKNVSRKEDLEKIPSLETLKSRKVVSTSSSLPLTTTPSSTAFSSTFTAKPPVAAVKPMLKQNSLNGSSADDDVKPNLTKTITLPTSLSDIVMSSSSSSSSTLPKSTTLPLSTSRPQISKPVLRAATPSAVSLISKAPSTGVSQSSILVAGGNNKEKEKRASRGVVFCDPITLPSPTNPNTPPIIHQPNITTAVTPTTSNSTPLMTTATTTTVTPFWSKIESPKTLVDICHIDDDGDGGGGDRVTDNVKKGVVNDKTDSAPMASPESDKISSSPHGISGKIKSKLSRKNSNPPPERPNIRNLEISSPVLQSQVELKTNLVPICRTSSPTTLSPSKDSEASKSSPSKFELSRKPLNAADNASPSERSNVKYKFPWKTSKSLDEEVQRRRRDNVETTKTSTPPQPPSRPVSIATSRPTRPSDPPPPRPAYKRDPDECSDDNSSNATTTTTLDKQTPPGSPLLSKRSSPDTISTCSSNDGGDLMKEILCEMDKKIEAETGESDAYSTLMRKNKKSKKNKS